MQILVLCLSLVLGSSRAWSAPALGRLENEISILTEAESLALIQALLVGVDFSETLDSMDPRDLRLLKIFILKDGSRRIDVGGKVRTIFAFDEPARGQPLGAHATDPRRVAVLRGLILGTVFRSDVEGRVTWNTAGARAISRTLDAAQRNAVERLRTIDAGLAARLALPVLKGGYPGAYELFYRAMLARDPHAALAPGGNVVPVVMKLLEAAPDAERAADLLLMTLAATFRRGLYLPIPPKREEWADPKILNIRALATLAPLFRELASRREVVLRKLEPKNLKFERADLAALLDPLLEPFARAIEALADEAVDEEFTEMHELYARMEKILLESFYLWRITDHCASRLDR